MGLEQIRKQAAMIRQELAARAAAVTAEPQGDPAEDLAALAAEAWGQGDVRARAAHIRTLDEAGQLDVYAQAMEELARQWVASEEGKEFKALPWGEQVQLCRAVSMQGKDILLVHGMRKAMRRW
jgi:hypothetical protein